MGGSAILDLGIYTLQLAQYIFKDEPIKVTAVGELNDDGVDLVDTVILEYAGGRRAVLNAHSKLKLWNKATVVGPLGRVTVCTFYNTYYFTNLYIRFFISQLRFGHRFMKWDASSPCLS